MMRPRLIACYSYNTRRGWQKRGQSMCENKHGVRWIAFVGLILLPLSAAATVLTILTPSPSHDWSAKWTFTNLLYLFSTIEIQNELSLIVCISFPRLHCKVNFYYRMYLFCRWWWWACGGRDVEQAEALQTYNKTMIKHTERTKTLY